MPLTSQITEYDSRWPSQFDCEVTRLRPIFGEVLAEVHHVGSTAVPGLAAKPEIDILIVVAAHAEEMDWSAALAGLGYRRGGNLSIGHQFYKRDVSGIRTHKLHICVTGHIEIARMLEFRDLLRQSDPLRQDYQSLKMSLERSNTLGIGEYLEKKAPFINTALAAKSCGKLP